MVMNIQILYYISIIVRNKTAKKEKEYKKTVEMYM